MEIKLENRIGQGNTAEIFQLENGKIAKLFRSGLDKGIIIREYENALAIQEALDFVPIAYEMFEHDGRYGIVYQKIDGIDMLKLILGRLWKINDFARKLAAYHRSIQKPVEGKLMTVKEKLEKDILYTDALTQEEKEWILSYLTRLPEGNVLCHFDFHPGNIMIAKEKIYVLDWMTACKGSSCADIMRTSVLLNYGEVAHAPWLVKKVISVFQQHIYKIYIKEYLRGTGYRMEDILQWKLPIIAARLSEWLTDHERDRLLRMVKAMLAEQYIEQRVQANEN